METILPDLPPGAVSSPMYEAGSMLVLLEASISSKSRTWPMLSKRTSAMAFLVRTVVRASAREAPVTALRLSALSRE